MKTFVIFGLIFCLTAGADGLQCVFSINDEIINAYYPCSLINDRYCYDLKYTYVFPNGTIENLLTKGCANDLGPLLSFGVECTSKGNKNINKNGMNGTLYCCDSDLCNNSNNHGSFGIFGIFISAITVLLFNATQN